MEDNSGDVLLFQACVIYLLVDGVEFVMDLRLQKGPRMLNGIGRIAVS